MAESIGLAIIGTGMWGKRLAAAVQRTPGLRLVTCYSRDEGKRAAFAEAFDCLPARSLEEAIAHPQVRGALLVTPNSQHLEGALAFARRGVHVFVEKPIADTLEDGRAMQAAFEQSGLVLMVGHGFRRLGAARKVKELLEAGELGQVALAEANFSLPGKLAPDQWRSHRRTCPGGPLMQLGIHHADTLGYWLGPVRRIQGSFGHLATSAEIDDVGLAALEYASGVRACITSSYVSPKTFSLRLYGTRAVLDYVTDMSVWPEAERMDAATKLILRTESGRYDILFEPRDMLVEELLEFGRCIRGEARPETGAMEGLAALEVVRGALRSHETGQVYSVPDR